MIFLHWTKAFISLRRVALVIGQKMRTVTTKWPKWKCHRTILKLSWHFLAQEQFFNYMELFIEILYSPKISNHHSDWRISKPWFERKLFCSNPFKCRKWSENFWFENFGSNYYDYPKFSGICLKFKLCKAITFVMIMTILYKNKNIKN